MKKAAKFKKYIKFNQIYYKRAFYKFIKSVFAISVVGQCGFVVSYHFLLLTREQSEVSRTDRVEGLHTYLLIANDEPKTGLFRRLKNKSMNKNPTRGNFNPVLIRPTPRNSFETTYLQNVTDVTVPTGLHFLSTFKNIQM